MSMKVSSPTLEYYEQRYDEITDKLVEYLHDVKEDRRKASMEKIGRYLDYISTICDCMSDELAKIDEITEEE